MGSGASRTRTDDLLGAIQALSQLSYSPASPQGSRIATIRSLAPEHAEQAAAVLFELVPVTIEGELYARLDLQRTRCASHV